MRTLINTIFAVLSLVTPALAAGGGVGGSSVLLVMFLGFFALVVVFQFIPALVLFYNMLKGLFSAAVHRKNSHP